MLYHGTTASDLESVMTDPRPDKGREGLDFGRGLYATTQPRQALQWAMAKATPDNPGAVVVWYVPNDLYAGLSHYRYDRNDAESMLNFRRDVWGLYTLRNRALRQFKSSWPGTDCDVVDGPVARWPAPSPETIVPLTLSTNADSSHAPIFLDQHVLRTTHATDVLCHDRSRVCAVVLLSCDVLRAPAFAELAEPALEPEPTASLG